MDIYMCGVSAVSSVCVFKHEPFYLNNKLAAHFIACINWAKNKSMHRTIWTNTKRNKTFFRKESWSKFEKWIHFDTLNVSVCEGFINFVHFVFDCLSTTEEYSDRVYGTHRNAQLATAFRHIYMRKTKSRQSVPVDISFSFARSILALKYLWNVLD